MGDLNPGPLPWAVMRRPFRAVLLPLVLGQRFPLMVRRMQQFMGFGAVGFAEVVLVEEHHVGIFVRDAERFVGIDRVERLHSCANFLAVRRIRLSAAADAAAGTGHHFDEMQIGSLAAFDPFQQFFGVTESVDDRDADIHAVDVQMGFLDPVETANGFHGEIRKFLAGQQEIRGSNRRFHDAAACAENLARRRPNAERRIRLFRGEILQVHPEHPEHLSQFPRGENGVDVMVPVTAHFTAARLEFFRRAWHHGNAEHFFRVEFFPFGVKRLDDGAKHLLRTFTGRKIGNEFRVKRFNELDPAGRTACKHRENAAVFDPVDEFGSFFHNRQVRAETGVKDLVESESSHGRVHDADHIGSDGHVELVADGNGNRRSVLNDDVHFGVFQGLHDTGDVRFADQRPGRASGDALAAIDATGNIESFVERRSDRRLGAAIDEVDASDPLNFFADANALAAFDTL